MSDPRRIEWPFAHRPNAWYWVCASRDLPPGHVRRWDLPGRSFVIYRGLENERVHALAAHCAHMGTHLGGGKVVGDSLRCPLHHWEWGGDGRCRRLPGSVPPHAARQETFPVGEKSGSIFLFNGSAPLYPTPDFEETSDGPLRVCVGSPVRLRCPWVAIAANAFDIQHLETVHGRTPRSAPVFEHIDPFRVRLRYVSRVTGRSPLDQLIRWISANHVQIVIRCLGGTVITVQSRLGRWRSSLMLCLRPLGEGIEIVPIFGIVRGRAGIGDHLRLRLTQALYSWYMRRDLRFMDDMRFQPGTLGPTDPILHEFLKFLGRLPVDSGSAKSSWETVSSSQRSFADVSERSH